MNDVDPQPVVFAYDGSDPARAAIAHAGLTLRATEAVVVTVWAPVEPVVPAAAIAAPGGVALSGARALDARARERAEQIAEEGAELARSAGFVADARVLCRSGPPWRAIVECAADLGAAMIVTGTRGRSRPLAAVLGSTAAGIVHHAHRAVLVVRDG